MKYAQGNIFEIAKEGEAICITTNGIVKEDGNAVMSAGIAKTAVNRYGTMIQKRLGDCINTYGNRAFILGKARNSNGVHYVLSFPTKHDWKNPSDINLIIKSAEQIMKICDKYSIPKCYITKVGCGNGKLNWESTVEPWLSQVLDDRFVVVTLEPVKKEIRDDGKLHILVAGSRDFNNYDRFDSIMNQYLNGITDKVEIVSGGARGVDSFAERYAQSHHLELKVFKAQWDLYGRSAGYRRNEEMHDYISSFKNRSCICVWDGKSKGTSHNFGLSHAYNTPISIFNYTLNEWLS